MQNKKATAGDGHLDCEENKMQEQAENNKSKRLLRVILCMLLISAVSLSALPLFSSLPVCGTACAAAKNAAEDNMADYLQELDQGKPVIACGDYNVAHKEIDLAHPDNNHMSPGFTDEEREGFTQLLSRGFIDSFRHLHGDVPGVYSWWAQRVKTSKINNSGWRIDYFLVSDRIKSKVKRSEMMDSGPRQDHTPLLLEIDL